MRNLGHVENLLPWFPEILSRLDWPASPRHRGLNPPNRTRLGENGGNLSYPRPPSQPQTSSPRALCRGWELHGCPDIRETRGQALPTGLEPERPLNRLQCHVREGAGG